MIIHGRGRVTADTELRFSKYSGTLARAWTVLQDDYGLEERQEAIREQPKQTEAVSSQAHGS